MLSDDGFGPGCNDPRWRAAARGDRSPLPNESWQSSHLSSGKALVWQAQMIDALGIDTAGASSNSSVPKAIVASTVDDQGGVLPDAG
jgi:hypothetical protein